jgi:hypothetical protein
MTMSDTLSPAQIAAFEKVHGFAAYDRCVAAERRARMARRSLAGTDVTPIQLERQGLPAGLARAYCSFMYGPAPEPVVRMGPPPGRR